VTLDDADHTTAPAAAGPAGATGATGDAPATHGVVRWAWFVVGWVAVALGSLGTIVPGLPTTVFFIVAASAFAKSSPRFERWVLALPGVGPMVRDHRDGLGMSRRAKGFAIGTMLVVSALSIALAVRHPVAAGAIVAAVAVGAWYVGLRVPTRERVLAERGLAA
jgi:uncharacterized protein